MAASATLAAQAAIAPIVAAVDAVAQGHDVDVSPLLAAVRASSPRAYPGAGSDDVDVPSLVAALGRHAHALDDDGVFSPTFDDGDEAAARAVLDALCVALEAKKLAHGLVPQAAALKASFASPAEAKAVLQRVVARYGRAGEDGVDVIVAGLEPSAADMPDISIASGRPAHIVVGAPGGRLAALLSPSVRRLRVELALLGRKGSAGAADDDDVYRGLAVLDADAPQTVAERRARDADEGVVRGERSFVIDAARLNDELVDRRARAALLALKRTKAVIVGVPDAGALLALPAVDWRTATILSHGDGQDDGTLVDAATGHLWPGGSGVALSVPWRGLAPAGVDVDEGGFALAQAWAHLRLVRSTLPACLRVVVRRRDGRPIDDSDAALTALTACARAS